MKHEDSIGTTRQRRAAIVRLARAGPIPSQDALQHLLLRQGIRVAQPTLSRDLKRLGLLRSPAGYVAPPATPGLVPRPTREGLLDRTLRDLVLSVRTAGSLVVLRTHPADAHPVARALDEAELPDVAGTIAGDDTVFVAAPGNAAARRLARRLAVPLAPRRPARRVRA
jgi:transcriptional regulator of arginine metabolism